METTYIPSALLHQGLTGFYASLGCLVASLAIALQGAKPLKETWQVEEGIELHSLPFSKPLGAVLAGHPWYSNVLPLIPIAVQTILSQFNKILITHGI